MVSLDFATWRVYRLLQAVTSLFAALRQKYNYPFAKMKLLGAPTLYCCSQMDFTETHNNGKDLLIYRKDPWAQSKGLIKGLLLKKQFLLSLKALSAIGTLNSFSTKTISKDLKGPWEPCVLNTAIYCTCN